MKSINQNLIHCVEVIALILATVTTMVDSKYYYYSYSYYYYYSGYSYYYYDYGYYYGGNSTGGPSSGGIAIIVIFVLLLITLLVFKITAICLMRCLGVRYRTAWCILCCCRCKNYRDYEIAYYSGYP